MRQNSTQEGQKHQETTNQLQNPTTLQDYINAVNTAAISVYDLDRNEGTIIGQSSEEAQLQHTIEPKTSQFRKIFTFKWWFPLTIEEWNAEVDRCNQTGEVF